MLSKKDIQNELGKQINIYPLCLDNIKENSVNFTLSEYAWSLSSGSVFLDSRRNKFRRPPAGYKGNKFFIAKGESAVLRKGNALYVVLLPHATTIVETKEVIGVGNHIGGTLHSKVGTVALGVGSISTMLGPNFCGHLMISLHNVTDEAIELPVGDTFVSLVFYYLKTPTNKTKNPNISGHVDKLAELEIEITPEIRKDLAADWKCDLDEIRKKMLQSDEFKKNQGNISILRRYINLHNFIVCAVVLMVVFAIGAASWWIDQKTGSDWFDKYWSLVVAIILLPVLSKIKYLFKTE